MYKILFYIGIFVLAAGTLPSCAPRVCPAYAGHYETKVLASKNKAKKVKKQRKKMQKGLFPKDMSKRHSR